MQTVALDTSSAEKIALVAILAVLVGGALISAVITAIVGRLIVIGLVIVVAGVLYLQRESIFSDAKNCDASFLGVHLTPSNPTLKQHCQDLSR